MKFFIDGMQAALLLLLVQSADAASNLSTKSNCSCGYYDSSTTDHFTDSIIVYFNETDGLPNDDFTVESYENRYEKGWNTQYRQGAIPANVNIGNSSSTFENQTPPSLELYCNVTTPAHLVEGGGIRTTRQDIFFGSFRASFRGTPQYQGGSALSMMAFFNETQSWQMDNINPNEPKNAWVSMLSHSQFPDRSLGVNYTALQANAIEPWNWTDYRVDWSRDEIRYYIGGKLFRRVTRHQDALHPQTPAPIFFKHWSTGNFFSTQGPPAARSLANVAWVRLFFNSSLTTDQEKEVFTSRCKSTDACSINDMDLRGSSARLPEATLRWKQSSLDGGDRMIPRLIAYTSISATALVLLFAFLRRAPWNFIMLRASRRINKKRRGTTWLPPITASGSTDSQSDLFDSKKPEQEITTETTTENTTANTTANTTRASSLMEIPYVTAPDSTYTSRICSQSERSQTATMSEFKSSANGGGSGSLSQLSKFSSDGKADDTIITIQSVLEAPREEHFVLPDPDRISSAPHHFRSLMEKDLSRAASETIIIESVEPSASAAPKAKVRVDYLAGLVAMSSLLVTAIHFCLTFAAAAINPDAYVHSQSEIWARKTVTSYLLNLNWIGPFLMTSTRFLVSTYLKTGNPRGLAEKTVGRPFRLLIPITVIAMLEYFFMDSGATAWLEYLASVTWSTWPFTTVPKNFGNFISEILQLAYLIPNAAPQITFNYCTGVLWTIPVQLQGSWTTIMAVIMVREIKTPWKRFCFYAWCVLVHWYALSWATYFYLAIMLTDLDITFNWKKWLYSHATAYYPLVTLCALLAFGGLTIDLITQWKTDTIQYAQYEYGVHPDPTTGRFIIQTPWFAYPQYYVPKLNGLLFSVAFQAFVELSPLAQKALSIKFFTFIFPHIFTIYLIHGFIFWSLGSMICVYLSTRGLAYSVNVTIVAVTCYAAIALCLPVLTPVVETLGKNVTGNIWRHASEEPAPRRPTLYPFPRDLLERSERGQEAATDAGDVEKGRE